MKCGPGQKKERGDSMARTAVVSTLVPKSTVNGPIQMTRDHAENACIEATEVRAIEDKPTSFSVSIVHDAMIVRG